MGVVLKKKFYIFGGYDGDSRLNDFHYFLIDERTCEIQSSTLLLDLENQVGNKVFSKHLLNLPLVILRCDFCPREPEGDPCS